MAGFSNDTVFGTNFNFSGGTGSSSRSPSMLLDGQILIGSTALNVGGTHCNIGTLTAGSGISIINGPGTITIVNTGGGGPVTGTTTLAGNTGAATEFGGIINVIGAPGLTTSGAGQTLTITPTLNLAAVEGLSGPGFAVETGVNTWAIRTLMAGAGITITNPQGIAGDPVITASPNVPLTFNTDSGSAVPAVNTLNIDGTGVQGVTTSGAGSTVTITVANATATQKGVSSFNSTEFTVTAGAVASNALTITAGTGLTGGGSVNLGGTVSVALDIPVTVAHGGTGDVTLTQNGVLYGNGTSPVGITAAGTNGQVLIGSTGAAPAFATILGTNGITFVTGANSLTISNTSIPNSALANSSITLSNGANITVTGSPVSLGGTATIAVSGTTNHTVQVGNVSGSLTSLGAGTDGQVLIGATGANPAFASLTSSDSSITFTAGANTLDLKASVASTTLTKLTPDDGGAVSAVANNINVLGIKDGATAQVTMTHNQAGNFTVENRAHLTPYVVDPSSTIGSRGTFTTIATAITAAVADGQPRDIFIKPGIYTENLTLATGINLTAFSGDELTPNVTIIGKCTYTAAGSVTISNIRLQTNSDFFLAVTGSAASIVNVRNCYLNFLNNTGISFTTANTAATINLNNCNGDIGTTGIAYYSMSSTGDMNLQYTYLENTGASTTQSTNTDGHVTAWWSRFAGPIATATNGEISFRWVRIQTTPQNITSLTHNATGGASTSSECIHCIFGSGSASAISIGAGANLNMSICQVNSVNTNAITGSGTLSYANLTFPNVGVAVNTSTQTVHAMGPAILLSGGCQLLSGSGSPNGSVTAPKGSMWLRTDGTTINNRFYINQNGGTSWTAGTTVA